METKKEIIQKHGLVVSCQALQDEPLHGANHMAAMAKAAKMGGAVGIRANSEKDVKAIKEAVDLPIIGLNKRNIEGFEMFITPTVEDAVVIAEAGAHIIAIDGTKRKRPDGYTLKETIETLKSKGIKVMADISTYDEGVYAEKVGADYVSTTLSGYTSYSEQFPRPNFELLEQLTERLTIPVVAEGNIKTGDEALRALELGAEFVVVGSAITRPQMIVEGFVSKINQFNCKIDV